MFIIFKCYIFLDEARPFLCSISVRVVVYFRYFRCLCEVCFLHCDYVWFACLCARCFVPFMFICSRMMFCGWC